MIAPATSESRVVRRAAGRLVLVLNQEKWERWHRELPPGLDVLGTIVVAREAMHVVRVRPSRPTA